MYVWVGVMALVSGCDFTVQPVPVDGAVADLAGSPDLADPPDLSPRGCPDSPALRACYRFEQSDGRDESMFANHATATGASFVPGPRGLALALAPGASVRAPDSATLDITGQITFELWVHVNALPAAGRAGLVDLDGQWGLFIFPTGELRCTVGSAVLTTPPRQIVPNRWTHVACSHDGINAHLYVDWTEVLSAPSGPLGTAGTSGLAIGSNSPSGDVLDGLIDDLRIWAVALTGPQE